MEQISRQLLYQRLRSRAIELLELHSSFEDIAKLGAYEVLNLADDFLSVDFTRPPRYSPLKKKKLLQNLGSS